MSINLKLCLFRRRHALFIYFFATLFVLLSNKVSAVGATFPSKIRVAIAINNTPYHFVNEQGQASGYSVDLWRLWQEKTGVEVEFVPSFWPTSIDNLEKGVVDVHSGFAVTPERLKTFSYGNTVYSISTNVYIHKNIVGISSFEQLSPYVVGVIRGAAYKGILAEKNPNIEFREYESRDDLLSAIQSNQISTFVELDYSSFQFHGFDQIAKSYPIYKSLVLSTRDLKLAVNKDNADWLETINQGFAQISQSKIDELNKKWLNVNHKKNSLLLTFSAGNEPYMSVNAAGTPSGLFVDLWKKWASKNKTDVSFIANNMALSLEALKQGKADVHIAYPESNSVKSGLPHARHLYSVYSELFVPTDYDKQKGLTQLNGKKLGLFKTAPYKIEFETQYPLIEIVWFDSLDELINASINQTIYGFVAEANTTEFRLMQNNLVDHFVRVSDLSYESKLFSLVGDGNFPLIKKIEDGFSNLTLAELEAIEQKWLGENGSFFKNNAFEYSLSTEEKNWLDRTQEIYVGVTNNWKPYEFVDENGVEQGISRDIFDIASQLTGQKYNFVVYEDWEELINDFKTGQLDLVANISQSKERENYARFTSPYWHTSWAVSTQKDFDKFDTIKALYGKKVAIVEGYQILNQMYEQFPQVLLHVVPSLDAALVLLEQGKVDAVLDNMLVLAQHIQDNNELNFKLHVLSDMKRDVSRIGIRKDLVLQAQIMEKVVTSLSESQTDAILNKWFKLDVESGISYKEYWQNITLASSVAAIIIFLVLFWNRKLQKEITLRIETQKKLKHLATHDGLTELPNRSLLNDRLKTAIESHARTQQKMAVMFIDLDGFKEVNDTFGHDNGDQLLIQVGQRLKRIIRKSDTLARIGGDEFILLVTHLDEYEQSEKVAAKALADISEPFNLAAGPISIGASIGIACYPKDGATNDELMKVADDLMYEVKNKGKNYYQYSNIPSS